METTQTFAELRKLFVDFGKAHEEFKRANDDRIKAVVDGNTARAAELDQKVTKIDADLTKLSKSISDLNLEIRVHQERLEEVESRSKQPGRTAEKKLRDEHKTAFLAWIRSKGMSTSHEQQMQALQLKMLEAKDVTVGSNAGGGYAVPEEIAREIEKLELKFSPVRRLVKVVQAGSSDYKELVSLRGATGGWVGESGSRVATLTPQLREVVPTFGELYAYPQASEWSLDDIFFNVEAWLAEEVADAFALQESDAVIRGNGSSKPTGMLNTAPTTQDDAIPPVRAAAAYQFIQGAGSPNELDADLLISLVYKLNSAYRAGAVWVMNSVTTGFIRRLKDLNGQYLWAPGLQVGQPDRLLGYPVETWEQLDDVGAGAGNFPVGFGNWRRAYVLADRVGLRVTRDNVTNVGFVRFYVRRREGGIVLNNDAVKWIRT